ncbi:polysaccharide deacetylase family protein [Psychrosphaera ytuae]|uniref:Polysaccharide deacetylase family protein n=1 Tax=Psychrosphaera ytuae TaxID=2820710 RepID=A0A975D9N7_9GAMM|nr:polysaccharide deacetylase family protein [Psychrosphaera ytuae]QTH62913.1 polysaccharide deacetylase family protein [Psychrosphaera ytuae]
MQKVLFTLVVIFITAVFTAQTSTAATVLIYHHVDENTPKSTSVTTEQFIEHLELIESLGLKVVPLPVIVNAIKDGTPVDHNWVALTFDDGFRNVYDNAFPILKERNLPFTVFVNPQMVKPSKLYMDWSQLKTLTEHGGDIMNHTLAHENLVQDGLTAKDVEDNILLAEAMIKEKLGQNHKTLAYPFGEYNDVIKGILKKHGFVGFAQHSGAIGNSSDLQALTRFPANGIYANPKTLKAKLNSIPFDFNNQSPTDTMSELGADAPTWTVELDSKDFYQSQLACFITGQNGPYKPEWLTKTSFKISAPESLQTGRVKYNCTAPSIKHSGRFYWTSKLWITLPKDLAQPALTE